MWREPQRGSKRFWEEKLPLPGTKWCLLAAWPGNLLWIKGDKMRVRGLLQWFRRGKRERRSRTLEQGCVVATRGCSSRGCSCSCVCSQPSGKAPSLTEVGFRVVCVIASGNTHTESRAWLIKWCPASQSWRMLFADLTSESEAGEWFCFRKLLQVLNKSVVSTARSCCV